MSDQDFKCGNCGTIQKNKFSMSYNYDMRYFCETCGPLCKDCHSRSLFSMGKCKGCGKEGKRQDYNQSGGKSDWYPKYSN